MSEMERGRFPCACCGYLTLPAPRGSGDAICPVCYWEDDPEQLADPSLGLGANDVSLESARENYLRTSASDPQARDRVREPRNDEIPPTVADE